MSEFIDGTSPVRKGEELDKDAISRFLKEAVPDLAGDMELEQFPSGYSNLTYMVKVGDLEMVLRRPPFGSKVKSAHDMGREYRIFEKLHPVYPKCPRPIAFCDDESIIGARFYVMERIKGIILRKEIPEGMDFNTEIASGLSENFIRGLAELHGIDYEAAGLGQLGKPKGYLYRQVYGWTDRYYGSQTDEIELVEDVIKWLKDNLPESPAATLIHNDYKYDNLVLAPDDMTKIIGVLDWEMSTIGDPLADLGSTLAYWVQGDDPQELLEQAFGPTFAKGSYTRRQLADLYAEITGRDISNISYYTAFGAFKLLVIIQQIYYRFVKGHTADERFKPLIDLVNLLSRVATELIERGTV